jgi:hypothetical protein
MQQIIPRLFLIILLSVGAIFAFIESEYYRSHTLMLAERAGSVQTWMWAFRCIAFVLIVITVILTISLMKR